MMKWWKPLEQTLEQTAGKHTLGGVGWLVALWQPPLYRPPCFSNDGTVNRSSRKGKAEWINSKNPTYIHCTQAQKEWEAARCAKAYLYNCKDATGSSRNPSAVEEMLLLEVINGHGQPGQLLFSGSTQRRWRRLWAVQDCRSHCRKRKNDCEQKARSAGGGVIRAGGMERPLEFEKSTSGLVEIHTEKGDTAIKLPLSPFSLPSGNWARTPDLEAAQARSLAQHPHTAFRWCSSNPFQVSYQRTPAGWLISVCGTQFLYDRFIVVHLLHNPFSSTHLSKESLKTLQEELRFFKTTLFESWTLCAILSKKITENKKQNKIWAKQNQI